MHFDKYFILTDVADAGVNASSAACASYGIKTFRFPDIFA